MRKKKLCSKHASQLIKVSGIVRNRGNTLVKEKKKQKAKKTEKVKQWQ